jgi:hypothetical protein
MSRLKELMMLEPPDLSALCASALLDAYCEPDARCEPEACCDSAAPPAGRNRMNEIAAGFHTMSAFYPASAAESERLELLDAIARELHRSRSCGQTRNLDPYVRLLRHLAHPDRIETCFPNRD